MYFYIKSPVLLENVVGLQLVKIFPETYKKRYFITLFTKARHSDPSKTD